MKAWRETNRTTPIDNEWVLIDTTQVAYIMEDQWYLAHDDYAKPRKHNSTKAR